MSGWHHHSLTCIEAGLFTGESHSGGSLAGLSVTRTYDASLRLDFFTAKNGSTLLQETDDDHDTAGRLWKVTSAPDVVAYPCHPDSCLVDSLTFNQKAPQPG